MYLYRGELFIRTILFLIGKLIHFPAIYPRSPGERKMANLGRPKLTPRDQIPTWD